MEKPYLIQTNRLGLRRWSGADFGPFCAMNRNAAVMAFYPNLLSEEETAQLMLRIEQHFAGHGYCLYAVEVLATGEFIGYTGFMYTTFEAPFTPCVEIGWRLAQSAWHQGYATEAASACLDYAFAKLSFMDVYSFTSVLNRASERVMQKIGMTKLGEFDHPKLPFGDRLRRHVLYRIKNPNALLR